MISTIKMGKVWALFLLGITTSSTLWANNQCCSYPTKWSLRSSIAREIFVQCSGETQGLGGRPILFSDSFNLSKNYTWNGWHNDGLGLNNATWTCAADFAPKPLDRRMKTSLFRTDFGENITINITSNPQGGLDVNRL